MFAYMRKLNDDGWRTTVAICIVGCAVCLWCIDIPNVWLFGLGLLIGSLYEQIIEWLAHGWLQHTKSSLRIFQYFHRRHERHHDEPKTHHALQSIGVWTPVVSLLLLPTIWLPPSLACGTLIGFLVTHVVLNILHYDLHAVSKVLPRWLRNTHYYRAVARYHALHHAGDSRAEGIYGISNPWLDRVLKAIGLTAAMDWMYPRTIRFLETCFTRSRE